MAGDIIIRLLGDTRDLERKFESVGSKLNKIGDKFSSVGKRLTIGVTAPLVAGGVAAFKFASDLGESMNKVDVVFGKASGSVKRFSADAARSLGISQQEALAAAGTFGNLFTAMGIGEQASANMSTSLVELAGDLASFNNVDPTEALDALRSGLTGETEPLKRFGVNINEATLKAKALELGLIDNTSAQKSNKASSEALADAHRGVADATQDAADRTESAARAVRDADEAVSDAEDRLRDAQRDAKAAQEALTDARKASKDALVDLTARVEENAVQEQRAVLRLEDAQKRLNEARESGDPREFLEAQLSLREAELSLQNTQRDSQRDQEELNKRRKQGVSGSKEFKDAQKRLAEANDNVKESQEGVSDAEERATLARKEQSRTAEDNARSIADAQRAVVRAQEKSTSSLKTATDVLSPAIKAQAAYALIMEQTKKTQGDFARTSDGAANKQRILTAEFKDQRDEIGRGLLPIGQKLLDFFSGLLEKFSSLSPANQDLVVQIAAIAAAAGPVLIAVGKMISVFGAAGKAITVLMANPIVLVIAAIVAAVILLVIHWDTVKAFLLRTWEIIKAAASAVFNFLKELFLNFTPLGQIIKHWDTIKGTLGDVWEGIQKNASKVFNFLKELFLNFTPLGQIIQNWDRILGFFGGVWDGIKTGFKETWGFVVRVFKSAINLLIDAWNALDFGIHIRLPKFLGGFGFDVDDIFPDIPRLAKGGVVTRPTLALIGEEGPEAVVPLNRFGRGNTPTVVNITINMPPGSDGADVVRAINEYERRNGAGWRASA